MTRVVWQITAGASSRDYADVLLRYDVALIAPGDAGPWSLARPDGDFDGIYVRRFASEMSINDILLLRSGVATIAAVGVVSGPYQYVEAFDDVNGLDLQHARRVRWFRLPVPYVFRSFAFGASPPRFSRVSDQAVLDFAYRFINSEPTQWQTATLSGLPAEDPPLEHIPRHLDSIIARVADLAPLFQDEAAFGPIPSEDELIVHFIVPFLMALGWVPERIGIKWRWIDVALFTALPRTPSNCSFVIEAKRLGAGVEGALEQAKAYATALGEPKKIVVTDGVRYRMYDGLRSYDPVAYANLARLKSPAINLFEKLQRP